MERRKKDRQAYTVKEKRRILSAYMGRKLIGFYANNMSASLFCSKGDKGRKRKEDKANGEKEER